MSAKNKDFALQSDVGEVRQIERVSYSSSAVKTPEQRGTPVSIISPISLTDSSTTACLRHGLELSTIAEDAENAEKNMTLWEGLRIYPRAIMWSLLISVTLIMEGYSTILIPNLNSMPAFQRDFGVPTSAGYEIPAAWQSAFVYTALAGQIVGLTITGLVAKKEGYKFMLQAALVAYTLSVFILFFATTKLALVLGQAAMGIPLGVFQCISGAYAVEVCPVKLRGYLTTCVNGFWVLGQLVASIVLRIMVSSTTDWSYRLPFALQWIFPVPVYIVTVLAPESPWYLARQGRTSEVRRTLKRLRTKRKDETEYAYEKALCGTLESITQTTNREQAEREGAGYLDCFRSVDRRRTEIACMTWIIQTLCGSTFMGFSTYFYEQAGLGKEHAFTFSLVQFTIGLLGVGVSWLLMARFGRRSLYLFGQALTFVSVFLIGVIGFVPSTTRARWSIASLLLVFTMAYDATIGPICYAIVTEIPSTRLRPQTIALARNSYNVSGILAYVVTPYMLNPTAWNWGAKMGFFWAVTCVLGMLWSWWRLPESKDKSFSELDDLFEQKVPARKFGRANKDAVRLGNATEGETEAV